MKIGDLIMSIGDVVMTHNDSNACKYHEAGIVLETYIDGSGVLMESGDFLRLPASNAYVSVIGRVPDFKYEFKNVPLLQKDFYSGKFSHIFDEYRTKIIKHEV